MATLSRRGNVPAESSEKIVSPAVADPPDVETSPPGAAENSLDQNRLTPCRRGAVWVYNASRNRSVNADPRDLPCDEAAAQRAMDQRAHSTDSGILVSKSMTEPTHKQLIGLYFSAAKMAHF